LLLAQLGASILVNDLGKFTNADGRSEYLADRTVAEIHAFNGKAKSNHDAVENGEMIVESAVREFKRIDILINNAGYLRDKSFVKLEEAEWDEIYKVHLYGAFKVTKAAWPFLIQSGTGR
jgi:NAD(P)-dependent dehydrogenase (short-subunit alcohol dehydrogenase family)